MSSDTLTLRKFEFGSLENESKRRIEILIQERISSEYGLSTWPSSYLLAEYLWFLNREYLEGKTVLELGCGTALPGLVSAACGSHVILTDQEDSPDILKNTKITVTSNNPVKYYTSWDCFEPVFLQIHCLPFTWANFAPSFISHFKNQDSSQSGTPQTNDVGVSEYPDLIIASDCFYDNTAVFDDIFATIYWFCTKNPNCKFLTSYQVRSASRNIKTYASKWNFNIREITSDEQVSEGFKFPFTKYSAYQNVGLQVKLIEVWPKWI